MSTFELVLVAAASVVIFSLIWMLTHVEDDDVRHCKLCGNLTYNEVCETCVMKDRLESGYYGERLKAEYARHTKRVDPDNPPEPFGRTVELKPPQVIGTISLEDAIKKKHRD